MNTESNTPPNGDFARYVEQLSARAGQSARVPGKESEHGLDVGMTPSPGAQGTTVARRESPAGEAAKADGTKAIPLGTLKVLAGMGAMVFLVLWAIGVPLSVLVLARRGGLVRQAFSQGTQPEARGRQMAAGARRGRPQAKRTATEVTKAASQ